MTSVDRKGGRNDRDTVVTGLYVLVVLLVTLALAAVAAGAEIASDGGFDWEELLRDYAIGLAAVSTAVLAAFAFARYHPDGLREQRFLGNIEAMVASSIARNSSGVCVVDEWSSKVNGPVELLRSKGHVVICTRFCDTWVELNEETILDFFKAGGTLRIFLPEPDCTAIHALTARQRAQKDANPNSYAEKSRRTGEKLQELRREAGCAAAALEVVYVEEVFNYSCWYCRDREELFVIWYEHRTHEGKRAPGLMIDGRLHPAIARYVEHDFEKLGGPDGGLAVPDSGLDGQAQAPPIS